MKLSKKLRQNLKRLAACVIALTMVFSNQMALLAAPKADGSESNAAENTATVIDYSHQPLGNHGYSFALSGNEWRYQTFTATETGDIDKVAVAVNKKNAVTAGFIDLRADLYAAEEGRPVGEPIAQSETKQGDQVNSAAPGSETVTADMITEFSISCTLEEGKQYAVVLKSSKTTGSGDDTTGGGQCYDWFTSSSEEYKKEGECFGKTNGIDGAVNWADESFLGTGWLKVFYAEKFEGGNEVDYTFESSSDGFGFGATGNEWRWQSFTSPRTQNMESVDLRLTKFAHGSESGIDKTHNLIVALYATNGEGLPTGEALAQTTVAEEKIESKVAFNVPLTHPLEKGVRYAIALTMETPLSLHGSQDCYGWATSTEIAAAAGEKFGKTNNGSDQNNITNNNWVVEALGAGYLKVNYTSEDNVESKIVFTAEKSVLDIDESTGFTTEVYNKKGELMEGAVVEVTSQDSGIAKVEGSNIIGVSAGHTVIEAKCGRVSAQIGIAVKDADGAIEPVPGLVITEDVKFKPGTYDFSGASTGLVIAADGITVDGTDVIIRNADLDASTEDVTSGAYAYQLNPADTETVYSLTRQINLSGVADIKFTYDVKGTDCKGSMKVSVSEDGAAWNEINSFAPTEDWSKVTANLSAYSGKTIYLRLAYESTEAVTENTALRIDTIELKEDGVRTFSDMAEAKVFYWWDVAYGNGERVADNMRDKPFDRTVYDVSAGVFKGTGISASNVKNVTIKGFTLSGFKNAMYIQNASGMTIVDNDLSNNFTDPNGGWGDQIGGALTLDTVNGSTIQNNTAYNNANGIYMKHSNKNTITDNEFAICSDVCLEMWHSSHNDIRNNDFSWGIRIDAYEEVHARDSTSQLMESGSNYNYFYRNDFTHGGDGIFIRVGNGWPCEGNLFEENDTSFANNNAVESWAGRNTYLKNKANYSSYGFWLGGSDESDVLYNEVAYNGIKPCNAAERGAGNGGIVFLNGTAEHIKIVGNDVHNNNGSGIAIRYDVSKIPEYVAGHILIQNNKITNTTKGLGNGDAIYLDSVDWVDVSGNLMEGNVNNGIYANPDGKNPVTNVTEREGSYIGSEAEYNKVVPVAKLKADRRVFQTDEEITFSAEDSLSPNGKKLSYRWSMGDGFGQYATVKEGPVVKFTFDKPGYYDVAVTVTDGTYSDIAWLNINVVAAGQEIGTDAKAAEWFIDEKLAAKSTFTNEKRADVQEAMIPEVKKYAQFSNYYTVDGEQSIYLESRTAKNTIGYPATKDLGKDFSEDKALSVSMKIHDARNWYSANSPTIRLYTDEENYFTYQAQKTYLSPLEYANLGCGQWRSDWVNLFIPYTGDENWACTVTGAPSLADINYIEVTAVTSGDGTEWWIDGLKSVYTGEIESYYGPSLSNTGKGISSEQAEGSDIAAPTLENIDKNARWYSTEGETSWYGVEYSVPRFVDRVELFLSAKGNRNLALPEKYEIQYRSYGEWRPVENVRMPIKVREDENAATFDIVETDAIRVVFTQKDHTPVSVYGFRTKNSKNYAAETDMNGNALVLVESSIKMDSVLESIDLVINVNDKTTWPQEYSDFVVYITEASEDGTTPTGPALAKGTVTKDEITDKGFGEIYNIPLEAVGGGQLTLKPGMRYVVVTTSAQVKADYPDKAGEHYRWATVNGIAPNEHCGKVTDTNPDNIVAHEEALGTHWMRLHTDRDEQLPDGTRKAQIDYSWEPLPTAGFGTGHAGEAGRYQTFTMPLDLVTSIIDGDISEGNGWSTKGQTGDSTLTTTFQEEKQIGSVNIFFEKGSVPEKFLIETAEGFTKEVTDLHAGFNFVEFDEVTTSKMIFTIPADSTIRELEIMPGVEKPAVPTEMKIAAEPKTEYKVNEALDVAGGKILVKYSDGTEATLDMTEDMISGFDTATAGKKNVTVTYAGLKDTYMISVTAADKVALENIRISRNPDKVQYKVGEELDLTGIVVEAVYSDGTVAKIDDYTVAGYDKTKIGKQDIEISYEGKTTVLQVEVLEDKPDGEPDDKPDGKPDDKPDGKPDDKPDGEPNGKPDGKPGSVGVAKTGDSSVMMIWFVVMVISVVAAAILRTMKKRSS